LPPSRAAWIIPEVTTEAEHDQVVVAVGEAPRLDIGLLLPQRFARKTAE
jgi:hypothetical protein